MQIELKTVASRHKQRRNLHRKQSLNDDDDDDDDDDFGMQLQSVRYHIQLFLTIEHMLYLNDILLERKH